VRKNHGAWLAASAGNAEAWREAQHLWRVLGEAGDVRGNQPALRSHGSMRPPPSGSRHGATRTPSGRFGRRRLAIAAGAVAAVCLAVIVHPAIGIWLNADYSTAVAETREIRLEDGSVAILGADSALEVSFEKNLRRVHLLSGEAYFEVSPDSARPFQVRSGDVDTTVLGTAFDVNLKSDGVAIAVNHGRVAVSSPVENPNLATPLTEGDWVRVNWSGAVERGNDAPELVGSWRSGMLAVRDESIANVVQEIGRHYRGRILVTGSELGRKRVTGVYNLASPVDAVHAVAQAHGARVRQISPWLLVVTGP
jgi:transmembrane sensor